MNLAQTRSVPDSCPWSRARKQLKCPFLRVQASPGRVSACSRPQTRPRWRRTGCRPRPPGRPGARGAQEREPGHVVSFFIETAQTPQTGGSRSPPPGAGPVRVKGEGPASPPGSSLRGFASALQGPDPGQAELGVLPLVPAAPVEVWGGGRTLRTLPLPRTPLPTTHQGPTRAPRGGRKPGPPPTQMGTPTPGR